MCAGRNNVERAHTYTHTEILYIYVWRARVDIKKAILKSVEHMRRRKCGYFNMAIAKLVNLLPESAKDVWQMCLSITSKARSSKRSK